jgi:hypothetical protein
MWEILTPVLAILAALGLWALLAGDFLRAMRRTKKDERRRDQ